MAKRDKLGLTRSICKPDRGKSTSLTSRLEEVVVADLDLSQANAVLVKGADHIAPEVDQQLADQGKEILSSLKQGKLSKGQREVTESLIQTPINLELLGALKKGRKIRNYMIKWA